MARPNLITQLLKHDIIPEPEPRDGRLFNSATDFRSRLITPWGQASSKGWAFGSPPLLPGANISHPLAFLSRMPHTFCQRRPSAWRSVADNEPFRAHRSMTDRCEQALDRI